MQNERNSNRISEKIRQTGGGKLIMCGEISAENGKKGGRPKYNNKIRIDIPNVNLVILTPEQYGSLIEKYGYELLHKAVLILESWLKTSPQGEKYRGRNNYAHFRADGWLINCAKTKN